MELPTSELALLLGPAGSPPCSLAGQHQLWEPESSAARDISSQLHSPGAGTVPKMAPVRTSSKDITKKLLEFINEFGKVEDTTLKYGNLLHLYTLLTNYQIN